MGGTLLLQQSYKSENRTKRKKKDNSAEIKRLTDIADIYYDANKKDSAFYIYSKVEKLCNPKRNTIDYVYAITSIADLQQLQGNYIGSEETATKALPYLKYIKKTKYASNIYNIQGINYTNNDDYDNALIYFKKNLNLKTSTWRKSMALNNIAAVYMYQKKYKKAKELLEILALQKDILKFDAYNNNEYAFIIDNLGYCYFKLKDYRALNSLYQGLKIRLQPKNNYGLITSYIHLSIFFQKNNPKLATAYALKAYKTAIKNNSTSDQINSLRLIIKSSKGATLKKYTLRHIQLTDSLDVMKKKAKNQFTTIKYIYNTDREENLQLKTQKVENELELERQKSRNILSYIILLLIVGIIIFLYLHLTSKGRKEKNEAIYKREVQISEKLHDEIANDVYQTLSFAKNKNLELRENKNQLLKNLDVIYSRTRDISKENSTVITDQNYSIALIEMISSFKSANINLLLNGIDTISWNEIEKNKKITLYRVLQELLVNMKKHSDASLVGINFKTTAKSINVNYTDNGKGIDLNTITFKNGLHNVENRILAIKGIIDIDSAPDKGFKVFIKFPI